MRPGAFVYMTSEIAQLGRFGAALKATSDQSNSGETANK